MRGVRLACVRHAASVRSEPGSNSQVNCPACPSRSRPGQSTEARSLTHYCAPNQRRLAQGTIKPVPGLHPEQVNASSKRDTLKARQRFSTPPPAHPFLSISTCQRTNRAFGIATSSRGAGHIRPGHHPVKPFRHTFHSFVEAVQNACLTGFFASLPSLARHGHQRQDISYRAACRRVQRLLRISSVPVRPPFTHRFLHAEAAAFAAQQQTAEPRSMPPNTLAKTA